jgi:hypothetical protein
LRQFSVCKHAIACTPAGSLAFVAHGSAYSNRSPYRHDSGLPQVSGGSAPAYDFSRPPRRSQLSYGLLTRHTAERRVFLEGFDGFVTSTATPIATGWSDLCRVGIAPTEKLHLFTTHRHPGAFRHPASAGSPDNSHLDVWGSWPLTIHSPGRTTQRCYRTVSPQPCWTNCFRAMPATRRAGWQSTPRQLF